ncbi:hypothetical protein BpHYR1_033845 [Brachionus plicatilis]|uniref:Uncharacterized protein n=1 Tax=Brachionus plicatilis TaxID=10195 RepID=A0A3M7S1N0_BRAPC|nr:hypothetical protein BpHYR1_033845 [Brachionus plicatilis]
MQNAHHRNDAILKKKIAPVLLSKKYDLMLKIIKSLKIDEKLQIAETVILNKTMNKIILIFKA